MSRGRGEFFDKVVREGLAEKVTFEEDLKGVKNPTIRTSAGESGLGRGSSQSKVQRQKHAWHD